MQSSQLLKDDIEQRGFIVPNNTDGDNDDPDAGLFAQNDTSSDKKAGQVIASSFAIAFYGILLLIFGSVSFIVAYLTPLAVISGGLVVSSIGHHQWRDAVEHFDDPSRVNDFVTNINIWEFTQNFTFTLTEVGIIVFDYCLGLIYLLFDFFYNLAVMMFKYILAPLAPYIIPVFTWMTRVAVQLLSGVAGAFGQLNQNNPGNFGSSAAETEQNDMDDSASRFFQVLNAIANFMNSMQDIPWHEFVNFLMDPLLKNLGKIFKFIANASAMLGKSGTWSKIFALDSIGKGLNTALSASLCGLEAFGNQLLCAGSIALEESICWLSNLVKAKCPLNFAKCDINGEYSDCSTSSGKFAAQNVESSEIDALFGAGVCDEVECEYFVEDLFTVFNQTVTTCPFWVSNPNAIYDCMLLVTQFSNTNNTSPSQANPSTIAIEICFVALAYNLQSCQDFGMPFIFDFEEASNDICNNTRYGASFTECSCTMPAPLCDTTCCHKYANHVNQQVVGQIGSYTCAALASTFNNNKVWCPLVSPQNLQNMAANNTRSPFPDNTYAFMWCSYFENVLAPACQQVASYTLISDLVNIDSVMPDYITGACNLTVNQVSVCVKVNTTIDNLAVNIMTDNQSWIDVYFVTNNMTMVEGTVIPTTFELGDSAQTIVQKTRNKHFCQQYAEINKNNNMILLSQPWNIESSVTEFCDNDILKAQNDLSQLIITSFYKYRQPNGNPIPKDLLGVPDTWTAFGDAVSPNTQTQACSAEHGLNPEEKQDLDACTQEIRVQTYNNNDQAIAATDDTLLVFDAQENYTSAYYASSGLVPIDPNSPNAAEQEQQLYRTTNAQDADVNFVDPPYQDLPNVTEQFRYNYSSPPSDYSPDSDNPGAPFPFGPKTHDTNNIGRVILSVHTNKPVAPQYWKNAKKVLFGIDDDKKPTRKPVTAELLHTYISDALVHIMGPATKHDRAYAAKTQKRILRRIDHLEEHMYKKYERQYKEQGHNINDVDHFSTARRVLSTGDVATDAAIDSLITALSNTPHTPLGTSPQNFNLFLENSLISRALYIFQTTLTKVLPAIVYNLLLVYNERSPGNMIPFDNITQVARNVFGSEQVPPSCKATMSDPYKCCGAATTSYDCCKGLIFCIPNLPQWVWITPTTSETIDKWYCDEFKGFWDWWKWVIKLLLSGFASIIKAASGFDQFIGTSFDSIILSQDEIPPNPYGCLVVNSRNMWYGFLIVYGIYFFISVQVFTLFILLFSNFRQQQAIQDDTVSNLQAQIKSMKERSTTSGFKQIQDLEKKTSNV